MARKVDAARKSQRDQFIALVSFAHGDCGALTDRTRGVLDQVRAVIGAGVESGAAMIRDVDGCLAALNRAQTSMREAIAAAQEIDVTVEVSEREPTG